MDDQDFEQDIQAKWYYGQRGKRNGPVCGEEINDKLRTGQLPLTTLVWREGMRQWKLVTKVLELLQDVPEPPGGFAAVSMSYRQAGHIYYAKRNAIGMFILLQLWLMGLLAYVVIAIVRSRYTGVACINCTGILGGIYAAVYLPLRWRTLLQLPRTTRLLGFIGAIGLIALLLLGVAEVMVRSLLGFSYVNFVLSLMCSPLAY